MKKTIIIIGILVFMIGVSHAAVFKAGLSYSMYQENIPNVNNDFGIMSQILFGNNFTAGFEFSYFGMYEGQSSLNLFFMLHWNILEVKKGKLSPYLQAGGGFTSLSVSDGGDVIGAKWGAGLTYVFDSGVGVDLSYNSYYSGTSIGDITDTINASVVYLF